MSAALTPDAPAGYFWGTCYATDDTTMSQHRHLVRLGGLDTACGASGTYPEVWGSKARKPKCPRCIARMTPEELGENTYAAIKAQRIVDALRILARTVDVYLGVAASSENPTSERDAAVRRARALLGAAEYPEQARWILDHPSGVLLDTWVPGTAEDKSLRRGLEHLASA